MAEFARVGIEGLREAQRAMKSVSRELPKELRKALNEVAEDIASGARRKVPTSTGKAAKSIKAASTQRAARIRAGGSRAPYYPWLDFGGKVGPKRSVSRPWRPGGRYLYPELGRRRDEIGPAVLRAVEQLAEREGLDAS